MDKDGLSLDMMVANSARMEAYYCDRNVLEPELKACGWKKRTGHWTALFLVFARTSKDMRSDAKQQVANAVLRPCFAFLSEAKAIESDQKRLLGLELR